MGAIPLYFAQSMGFPPPKRWSMGAAVVISLQCRVKRVGAGRVYRRATNNMAGGVAADLGQGWLTISGVMI